MANAVGREAARSMRAKLWARQATEGLPQTCPGRSAKIALSRAQRRALLAAALIGLPVSLVWPALPASLALCFFAVLIALRSLACFTPVKLIRRISLNEEALPSACILVPAYRETAIMPHLVRALAAIDYPRDKLDIFLVLEADDQETLRAVLACRTPVNLKIIQVPPGLPRTKPRALNFALRHTRADIIGILDAEDRPHPGQLREAAERFASAPPDLACLQAPLNWYNRSDSWITGQFTLEYAAHFNVMLPFYQRLRWPLPLGGTSNYLRRDRLLEIGGWDAYNVTEDADLGFRLAASGYRTGMLEHPTLEEAPVRLRPWLFQRSRWLKGYAQTLAVQLRERGQAGSLPTLTRLTALIFTLGAALFSAMLHAPLLIASIMYFATGWTGSAGQWIGLGFLSLGYFSAALGALVGMRRAGRRLCLREFLLMPVYWPLQTLAAARALWQWIVDPYLWDKTEHGQSQSCISP